MAEKTNAKTETAKVVPFTPSEEARRHYLAEFFGAEDASLDTAIQGYAPKLPAEIAEMVADGDLSFAQGIITALKMKLPVGEVDALAVIEGRFPWMKPQEVHEWLLDAKKKNFVEVLKTLPTDPALAPKRKASAGTGERKLNDYEQFKNAPVKCGDLEGIYLGEKKFQVTHEDGTTSQLTPSQFAIKGNKTLGGKSINAYRYINIVSTGKSMLASLAKEPVAVAEEVHEEVAQAA